MGCLIAGKIFCRCSTSITFTGACTAFFYASLSRKRESGVLSDFNHSNRGLEQRGSKALDSGVSCRVGAGELSDDDDCRLGNPCVLERGDDTVMHVFESFFFSLPW